MNIEHEFEQYVVDRYGTGYIPDDDPLNTNAEHDAYVAGFHRALQVIKDRCHSDGMRLPMHFIYRTEIDWILSRLDT